MFTIKTLSLDLAKVFFIMIFVTYSNSFSFLNTYSSDQLDVCSSEQENKSNFSCAEHCFLDSESKIKELSFFPTYFFIYLIVHANVLNLKHNLIEPKSNSPPLFSIS